MNRIMTLAASSAVVLASLALAVPAFASTSLFGAATTSPTGGNSGAFVQVTSSTSSSPAFGGITFSLPASTTVNDVNTLSTDYKVLAGDCAGGSPRFAITTSAGSVFVYLGPTPNFTGCAVGWQSTGNLLSDADLRVDTSQVGGTFYDTWAHAKTLVGTSTISNLQLVVDGGWAIPNGGVQSFGFDNTDINGTTYNYGTTTQAVAVTTNPATNITSSDATLNGTNGPTNATGHSFWVSTSTFSTASPSIPAGVVSTPDMGAIASNTPFSVMLSSLTSDGVPSNLAAIQPNTKYYFVAWSLVNGTWMPGAELSFTALGTTTPPTNVPTALGQCKNGGWMTMMDSNGDHLKNQGDCVSFVATKGKNSASGH